MKPIHALFSLSIAVTVLASHSVFAQTNAAPANDVQWRLVTLKNVPPAYMAWFVDAQHNPAPDKAIVLPSQAPTTLSPAKLPRANGGVFELPEGVSAVIPAPTQSGLLVNSTEQGVRQLQNIVELLDRPLREVEIKAQAVAIGHEDARALGLDLTSIKVPFNVDAKVGADKAPMFQLGFVRGNYQTQLARLVTQKKAEVVASFGVTSINNMSASMGVATSLPAVIGVKDQTGAFQSVFDAAQNTSAPRLFLSKETGFLVTPTVNNDGTITILMKSMQSVQLTLGEKKSGQMLSLQSSQRSSQMTELPQQSAEGITLSNAESATPGISSDTPRGVQVVVNIKDSDTIALVGLPRSAFDNTLTNPADAAQDLNAQVIVFITAHVLPPLI